MELIIFILIVACLIISCIEDFRTRTINWYWLPVILLLSFVYSFTINNSPYAPLYNLFYNGMILFVMLLSAKVYLMIKRGAKTKLLDRYIGLGDVLMILSLASLFRPNVFVLFLTTTFAITLLVYGLSKKTKNLPNRLIPLVSFLNISLTFLLTVDHFALGNFLVKFYQ